MGISIWQILIIVAVVVLLFGAGKIPRLMRDMGTGITAFRKGLKDDDPAKTDGGEKPVIEAEPDSKADSAKPESKAANKV